MTFFIENEFSKRIWKKVRISKMFTRMVNNFLSQQKDSIQYYKFKGGVLWN